MNAATAVYNPNLSHHNQAIAAVSAATTTSLLQNDGPGKEMGRIWMGLPTLPAVLPIVSNTAETDSLVCAVA